MTDLTWIPFDGPFDYNGSDRWAEPESSVVDERERQLFGQSLAEVRQLLLEEEHKDRINFAVCKAIEDSINVYGGEYQYVLDHWDTNPEFHILERWCELKKLEAEIEKYHEMQPEMAQAEVDLNAKADRLEKTSFSGMGLNKPGTLIEVEVAEGVVEQYLIGRINPIRGVCDDCTAFESDARVIRYAVVYEMPPESKE